MKQQIEWIPIKVRELTCEERANWCDASCLMTWDCPVPNDGEEVLVTLTNDIIDMVTFFNEHFDDYEWEEITAWARKPKPYKTGMGNEEFDYFHENYWKIDAYNQLLEIMAQNIVNIRQFREADIMITCDENVVRIDLQEPNNTLWITKDALLEVINEYEEWHTLKGNKKMPKGLFDRIFNDNEEGIK